METLDALAAALGLATLAGINLYLTVFAAGLAIRLGWVRLAPEHAGLEVLGEPWIIAIAGTLYGLEFFADKVPWVDSLNDAVQSFLRPLGGALLGVLALGEAHPAALVAAALLGGGAALTTHTVKAATRLVVNTSPEPVSNVGISLMEDMGVVGGLALLAASPLLGGMLALALLLTAWLFLPRLLRLIQTVAWLAWSKFHGPAEAEAAATTKLPKAWQTVLDRALGGQDIRITEAARCASGGGRRLPANLLGWLVRLESGDVIFFAPRWLGMAMVKIRASTATTTTRFLSEMLEIRNAAGARWRFHFTRGNGAAARLAAAINQTAPPTPALAA